MTRTSRHPSPSTSEEVTGRAPIIDSFKQKWAIKSDNMASRSIAIPSNDTATAATVTPAKAIATPVKAPATLANTSTVPTDTTLSKIITSSPKGAVTTSTSIVVPGKEAPAKATSFKATVTPAKPNDVADAAAETNISDNALPEVGDMNKNANTPSATKPVNKKRLRDSEHNSSGDAPCDKLKVTPVIKTGNKPKSATSQAGKRGTFFSLTKDKASILKIATRKKDVTSSAASSTAEPPPKRTKAFKSRRGPSFQAAEVSTASMSNDVPMEFSTTCFYVQLGDEGQTYFIHEHHLSKSPRLLDEVKTAKSKCRKTQQQIIQLLPHNAGAFGQMVGYLYSDQFKSLDCNKGLKMIGHRMKEIHEVMGLAKYYNMPEFQKDIMRVVSKDRLVHRVSVAAFFDWAEDMWYEEMDKKNGPFARYLQRHAPAMLHSATETDVKSMMRFIGGGGEYVKELFVAMHKAIALRGVSVIKSEPDINYR